MSHTCEFRLSVTFLACDDYAKERATSGCSRTQEDLRVFVKKIVSGRFYDVARNSLCDDDDDDDDDRKSRPVFAVTI